MLKKCLHRVLTLLFSFYLVYYVKAQNCNVPLSLSTVDLPKVSNKLSIVLPEYVNQIPFSNYTRVISQDYDEYGTTVKASLYKGENFEKVFALTHGNTISENVEITYQPLFNASLLSSTLDIDIINESGQSILNSTNQPILFLTNNDIINSPKTVNANTVYTIKLPYLSPNARIVFIEKITVTGCIPTEGTTHAIQLKICDVFINQTSSTIGGKIETKLVNKIDKTKSNLLVFEGTHSNDYCLKNDIYKQTRQVVFRFESTTSPVDFNYFSIFLFDQYEKSAINSLSVIDATSLKVSLLRLDENGIEQSYDLRNSTIAADKNINLGIQTKENIANCKGLETYNFFKSLQLDFTTNVRPTDKYRIEFEEISCCPQTFNPIREPDYFFQFQYLNTCGDWRIYQKALTNFPDIGTINVSALPTVFPSSINATRLTNPATPSAPPIITGVENFKTTIEFLNKEANLFIHNFNSVSIEDMYFVFGIRHENGIRLTEYDVNGSPINSTEFDYQLWNSLPQGTFNPKYPHSGLVLTLSNNTKINLNKLNQTDDLYSNISFSTYPVSNTSLFKVKLSDILPIAMGEGRANYLLRVQNVIKNATVEWSFEPVCSALSEEDGVPNYSFEWYFSPGDEECQKCILPLTQIEKDVFVNCPGCRFTGGDVYYSSAKRVTLGYVDLNNDDKPDLIDNLPSYATILQNSDSDPNNNLNLNTVIQNDVVLLKHHYYLTTGQSFPYGTAGQIITISDDIFGVNALTQSYLKVQIPKGFSIYESSNQKMKVTIRNGSTILFSLSNLSIFNLDGTTNSWIEEINSTTTTTDIVFNFSVSQLQQFGLTTFSSYKSNYSVEVEFFIQLKENIIGESNGLKNHLIVFKPYFSKVQYKNRDIRHNDGELEQFNSFQPDGDPYQQVGNQILYTWENFNSPNRFINEMSNIYYNSNKLLLCGASETSITSAQIFFNVLGTPNLNYGLPYYNIKSCDLFYEISTQVDFSLIDNLFVNEYRAADYIEKVEIPIPESLDLENIYFINSGDRSLISRYDNKNGVVIPNITLDPNNPNNSALTYIENRTGFDMYSLNISQLRSNGNIIGRGDEHEAILLNISFKDKCIEGMNSTKRFFPDKITSPNASPKFYVRENTIDISTLLNFDQNWGELFVENQSKTTIVRENFTTQVSSDNKIEYIYQIKNPELSGSLSSFSNVFTVIAYDNRIVTPPLLTSVDEPNQTILYFDIDKGNNIYWRFFYQLNSINKLNANNLIKLKLSTTFLSCPDNNFKLFIGYGHHCEGEINQTISINSLCSFTPPNELDFITVFVKEAFVNVSNVRYPNESCGQVELQYNLISNQGIAKDVSSTIQLPVSFNYNQQPITVRYGNNVLPSDQYSLSFISPSTLQLSILDQNIPFAKQLEIGTTAVDIIEVSIPLLYEEGCVLYSNVSIPISVRYTSICPEYKTETTTSLIPSLLNCPRTGSVMGRLSQPNGSGTILCKDSDNQFTPIQITFTQDPSMTSAYTYEWYQGNGSAFTTIVGQSSPTITVNNPSTIKVKVTDINTGCYGEFTTTVSDQIVFLPIDPVCKGQSPRLQLNGLNNVQGSITTSWFRETNPNELLFSLSEEGMYKAMAIVPGCTLTTATAYDIRFKEAPIPYIFERDLIYHGQNDVTISIINPTANLLGSVSIRWSHDVQKTNLESFNTNKDGVYSVTATLLSTGCSVISSTKIVSPQIRILPLGADACAPNSSIVLMAESNIVAGNYIWQKINPLTRVGTTISTSATVNISETGLYAVSNDLTVQTCDASYFYINLDKGSIRPIDLISNNSSDGNFENISSCSPVGFLTDYTCLSTVPDFSNPNYAQDLLGRFILTPNATLWNRPNLWTGLALNNPNYNIPAAQQQMMVVDGSSSSRVWSKEISIEEYPYFLQEFMFTAHVRNIESNAVAARREIPKMNYSISFRTSGPNPIQRLVSKGVLNEITFNTNQRNWIQMTAFVNRFQEFIGCADDDVESDFTHAIIELSLQNGGDIGRDFAIDEISFVPLDVFHCVENTTATTTSFAYRMVPRPCEASLFKVITTEFHTCPGIGATLTAQKYTDAASLSYSWSKDNTTLSNNLTISVNPPVTTTYTFRVVDTENQCSFEKAVTVYVTKPEISIQSNGINACTQPEISFEVDRFTIIGNISYEWSVNNQIIPNEKGRKFVHRSVTNGDEVSCRLIHHCTNPDGSSLLVQSNSIILKGQLEQANAGQDTSICALDIVTIGTPVNSVNTYAWSTPTETLAATSATVQVQPATTTTYTLQLTDANTCITEDDVVIHVKGPKPQVQAGPDLQVCSGSSVTATQASTNAASVLWSPTLGLSSPTDITPIFSPSTDTEFTLTATHSSTGCSASDNVLVVVYPLPSGELEYRNQQLQVQIQQPELYTYQWSGFSVPNTWSESYLNVSESGRFSVTVQNKHTGCSTTLFKDVQVTNIVAPDGSPLISLYPNPMQHRLHVHTHSSTSIKTMEWITVTGTVVQLNEINQPQAEISSYLASGMYILKITLIDGKILYHQMVIE
ncbi:MAG: T9SS type A sorting domain-containing protein [Cytophagaceae bacterium]|jgi:hypothetical protein|nr:T9SS type A sorting domain-containing protein [Cytophagaceae bacterium]